MRGIKGRLGGGWMGWSGRGIGRFHMMIICGITRIIKAPGPEYLAQNVRDPRAPGMGRIGRIPRKKRGEG